jgi:hypothetical protein
MNEDELWLWLKEFSQLNLEKSNRRHFKKQKAMRETTYVGSAILSRSIAYWNICHP